MTLFIVRSVGDSAGHISAFICCQLVEWRDLWPWVRLVANAVMQRN